MSSQSRGLTLEASFSKEIHKEGTPILVSSISLRRRGLGQVDIAHLVKNIVTIYEVKLNSLPGRAQYLRLRGSSNFLAILLGRPARFKIKSQGKVCLF